MFKVTVNKPTGEQIILETDNENMVLGVLRHCDVAAIDSDAPNRNVDPEWQRIMQRAREQQLPLQPFTVTC